MATVGQSSAQAFARALVVAASLAMPHAIAPVAAAAESSDRPDVMSSGLRLFLSTGCGACHRIAGTKAAGEIGPDLTHLASRGTIGATS